MFTRKIWGFFSYFWELSTRLMIFLLWAEALGVGFGQFVPNADMIAEQNELKLSEVTQLFLLESDRVILML